MYSSWGTEQNKMKLVILRHFLPFIPLKPPKIKILKNEKICWRYHHFTHVHQKSQSHDVWFLRQTKLFVILGHFLPFYLSPIMILNIESSRKKMKKMPGDIILLYLHVYLKWRSYDVWLVPEIWSMWQTEFFVILDRFLPFYPPNNPKNQTFEKMKSLICLNGSWYGACGRQNFLSFWTIFCPLTPLTTQKAKILEKTKKHLEILPFYTCVPQMRIIWGMVPEIPSATDRIFCQFGPFFPLLPP